jgi:hypothetical protein
VVKRNHAASVSIYALPMEQRVGILRGSLHPHRKPPCWEDRIRLPLLRGKDNSERSPQSCGPMDFSQADNQGKSRKLGENVCILVAKVKDGSQIVIFLLTC